MTGETIKITVKQYQKPLLIETEAEQIIEISEVYEEQKGDRSENQEYEDGDVVFEGLPVQLKPYLQNYTKEELLLDPRTVLQSICRIDAVSHFEGAKMVNALLTIIEEEKKSENNSRKQSSDWESPAFSDCQIREKNMSLWDDGLFANAEIQYTDPSELYEISYDSQIG